MATDYKRVSREFMDNVLDSPGVTYEPRGLFLCDQYIGGERIWTAMRNLDGEGLTEDFACKRTAVLWMHGHEFKEETYWRPDKKIEYADRLERLVGENDG